MILFVVGFVVIYGLGMIYWAVTREPEKKGTMYTKNICN